MVLCEGCSVPIDPWQLMVNRAETCPFCKAWFCRGCRKEKLIQTERPGYDGAVQSCRPCAAEAVLTEGS